MNITSFSALMYTFTDTDKKIKENSFNSNTSRASFKTKSSSVDGASLSDILAPQTVADDKDVSFTAVQGRVKDLFQGDDFKLMLAMAEAEDEIAGV